MPSTSTLACRGLLACKHAVVYNVSDTVHLPGDVEQHGGTSAGLPLNADGGGQPPMLRESASGATDEKGAATTCSAPPSVSESLEALPAAYSTHTISMQQGPVATDTDCGQEVAGEEVGEQGVVVDISPGASFEEEPMQRTVPRRPELARMHSLLPEWALQPYRAEMVCTPTFQCSCTPASHCSCTPASLQLHTCFSATFHFSCVPPVHCSCTPSSHCSCTRTSYCSCAPAFTAAARDGRGDHAAPRDGSVASCGGGRSERAREVTRALRALPPATVPSGRSFPPDRARPHDPNPEVHISSNQL